MTAAAASASAMTSSSSCPSAFFSTEATAAAVSRRAACRNARDERCLEVTSAESQTIRPPSSTAPCGEMV